MRSSTYREQRGHAKEQRQTLVVEHDDPHDGDGDGDDDDRGGFHAFPALDHPFQQPTWRGYVDLSLL